MVGGGLSIGGILTLFLADRASNIQVAFMGGKAFEGVAVGVIVTSTQTYMSEVIPRRLRGPALAFFPIFQLLGPWLRLELLWGWRATKRLSPIGWLSRPRGPSPAFRFSWESFCQRVPLFCFDKTRLGRPGNPSPSFTAQRLLLSARIFSRR